MLAPSQPLGAMLSCAPCGLRGATLMPHALSCSAAACASLACWLAPACTQLSCARTRPANSHVPYAQSIPHNTRCHHRNRHHCCACHCCHTHHRCRSCHHARSCARTAHTAAHAAAQAAAHTRTVWCTCRHPHCVVPCSRVAMRLRIASHVTHTLVLVWSWLVAHTWAVQPRARAAPQSHPSPICAGDPLLRSLPPSSSRPRACRPRAHRAQSAVPE